MKANGAVSFLHDANASQDEKMMELIALHGNRGVGVYWRLVERLRLAKDYRFDARLVNGIALYLGEPVDDTRQMLADMEMLGLFAREDEHFLFSASLRRRMDAYNGRRESLSEAGRKGGFGKAKARRESNWPGYDDFGHKIVAEPEHSYSQAMAELDDEASMATASLQQTLSHPLARPEHGHSSAVASPEPGCSQAVANPGLLNINTNTTEPKGSDPLLDPSTSLDGTVPNPSKPTRRAVRTRELEIPPLPEHLDTATARAALTNWLDYKRERGEGYKPAGLNALISKISDWDELRLVRAVRHSTSSNYAGLFEPKPGEGGRPAKLSNLEKAKELMRQSAMEAGND